MKIANPSPSLFFAVLSASTILGSWSPSSLFAVAQAVERGILTSIEIVAPGGGDAPNTIPCGATKKFGLRMIGTRTAGAASVRGSFLKFWKVYDDDGSAAADDLLQEGNLSFEPDDTMGGAKVDEIQTFMITCRANCKVVGSGGDGGPEEGPVVTLEARADGKNDTHTIRCVKDGYAIDDPHFRTWTGQWYDYMGACDLVFLSAPNFDTKNGLSLDIHIRTRIRHMYSYIETAALRIGDDILEVAGFGQHFFNGVENSLAPSVGHGVEDSPVFMSFASGGYKVSHTQIDEKHHKFEIQIHGDDGNLDEKILLTTFKEMVSVKLEDANSTRFNGSKGMMGGFETGSLVGRDGKTKVGNPNDLAAEYQVREDEDGPMLFQSNRDPQYPQKCRLPNPAILDSRNKKLRGNTGDDGIMAISHEQAKAACAHHYESRRAACIADVLLTGDIDIARSH